MKLQIAFITLTLQFSVICKFLSKKSNSKLSHQLRHKKIQKNLSKFSKLGPDDFKDIDEKTLEDQKIKKEKPYPGNNDCDEHDEPQLPVKHVDVNKLRYQQNKRFDKGAAQYLYDILEVPIKEKFKEEVFGAFNAYIKKSKDGEVLTEKKISDDDLKNYLEGVSTNPIIVDMRPGVDEKGLAEVFKDITFKQYKPETLLKVYASHDKDQKELSYREFTYFMIEFLSRRNRQCDQCYKASFQLIQDLFTFIDCDGDGLIEAKDIINVVILFQKTKNLNVVESKIPFAVSNSMVNSFFLNGMEIPTATMNLADFKYTIMMGFLERFIKDNQFSDAFAVQQEAIRKQNVESGHGPI